MKKTKGEKIFDVFNIVAMFLVAVIMLYPYLNQVAISFNDGMDAMRGGITVFPRKFTLANYEAVLCNDGFLMAVIVTVSRVVIHTVLALVVTFAAAYALSRRGLRWKKAITYYFLLPGYFSAGIIPSFILFRTLGLIDNYLIYILPGMFNFYNMVVLRGFLQELPVSIEESAMVDGANEIYIMFKMIIPMSMPAVATITLWLAVGAWNDWMTTLVYTTDPDLQTLQFFLMQMIKQSERAAQMALELSMGASEEDISMPTTAAVQAATLVATSLPIVLLYPFLQKYFIKGINLGAVKE